MALVLQTMFENSDEEIDVVTIEDERTDGNLVNFDARIWESPCYEEESDSPIVSDSDSEDIFIDVVNTSNLKKFLLEKTDDDDRVSSGQDVSTPFNDTEASTKISLKRKRQDLDMDDATAEVYSKRNKTNKQTNQSPNFLQYFTSLNHSTSESNQASLQRRRTRSSPVSPTNSPTSKKGVRSIVWFHCPKCNAEKIFDRADEQKHDLECINCEMKMCKGQLKIDQDKLKCILLTCIDCNLKTEATNVCLDSVRCPKCMSNFALSCRNCSKHLTGLLEIFCHVNKNCKFNFCNCHHCNHNYISMDDLKSHIVENHTSVVCPLCHAAYKDRNAMMRHKRLCNKPKNLHCCFCLYSTKYTYHLKRHLVTKHAKRFETNAELQAVHKKLLENGSNKRRPIPLSPNEIDNYKVLLKCNYYCPQCKKIVAVTGKHSEKHCSICNSITIYQCNKCGTRNKNYRVFYHHIRCTCYPKKVLSCDHCKYITADRWSMIRHMNFSHTYKEFYEQRRSSKLTHYCPRCEKTVDTTGVLKKKQCLVCKTFVLYQCNNCCHKYNSYVSFIYHRNDVCHPDRPS